MDSDIRQRLAHASAKLNGIRAKEALLIPVPEKRSIRGHKSRKYVLAGIVLVIALLTSIGVIFNQLSKSSDNGSPVPIPIQKGVAFPIYYPDPARLPAGFILDQNSFNRNGQVVVYSIDYDDKKIAFTIQAKPSEDEIKTFYTNQLPLRNETKTEAGTAMIGILNNQTFASLTTSDQAWLIITAPLDINQEQFKQVLHSIKR